MKPWSPVLDSRGVSIVEQMLFLALSAVVLLGVTSFFISHYEVNLGQEQVAEMQQNARIALDRVSREIWMGGYGVPRQAGIVYASENRVTFLNRLDKAYTTLSANLANGGTTLAVSSAAGFSVNDVIYLLHPDGEVVESPTVTAVNLGARTVTVSSGVVRAGGYPSGSGVCVPSNYTTLPNGSTGASVNLGVASAANFTADDQLYVVNPTNGTSTLRTVSSVDAGASTLTVQSALTVSYPNGSFVIKPLEYALEGSASAPRLVRRIGGVSQVLADNVESLRFTYYDASNQTIPSPLPNPYDTDPLVEERVVAAANRNLIERVDIRLAIRTSTVDPSSVNGDGYKRMVLSSEVALRNR